MAEIGKMTVNLAIEKTVQKALADAVQEIHKEHGLKINSLRFEWVETMDGKAFVTMTDMDSSARHP